MNLDPFQLAANLLVPQENNDPVAWCSEKLNIDFWSKQKEVAYSVRDNKRTVVAAAHAMGKTWSAAALICWWLETNQPGQAFVVTTAPSFQQVRAVLWRYINQLHGRHRLRGRVNQTEWHMGGELVGIGRKPSDHNESAFQGIHAPKILAVLDEAGGVVAQFWNAVEAITTTEDCRILAIGNPDFPQGPFRDAWDSEQWNSIKISAYDSPNFTGEVCPLSVKSNLASQEWVEDAKKRWGADSPIFQSKVLGLFPSAAEDSVIDYAKVASSINREPAEDDVSPVILGVDLAGGGSDMTVVRERRGMRALRQWTTSINDSAQLVDWLLRIAIETEASLLKIDSTGLGWGILGSIREKQPELNVVPINASQAAAQPSRYLNARAEMWWKGRMRFESGEMDLSEAEDPDGLLSQLTAPKWTLDNRGKIKIESKDDVRLRLGRSPDNADAFLLAFYDRWGEPVDVVQGLSARRLGSGKSKLVLPGSTPNMGARIASRQIGDNRWQ